MSLTEPTKPVLQPPGAGLPWWELLVAKYFLFPRSCRRMDWAEASRVFQEEGSKVLALWDSIPAARQEEKVLIKRIPGIEDSSRYWSAAMTVEHLTIVGKGIRTIIATLRRGEVPLRETRPEHVKPYGETAPAEIQLQFVSLLAETAAADAAEPAIPPGVGLRHPHPWFGPLDAHQWHCLLAVHQALHRKQMEKIRAGLGLG